MAHQPDAGFIALQEALAGEYSLDRELGRGGMGVVYLAREVRLARPVAIKVLPPALAARPDLRARFLDEARMAGALTHPNIVPIHAAGERGGFVYLVMAFVDGTTLGERIRTRGPLLPGQAARVLREVAWGLAYAHGARIVHRDVTAENILLERGSDRALITDFGLASAMQTAALTWDGHVMGNAYYVSPEQAVGEPMDARSDLYSLGVAGYYALTGRLPFSGTSSADVVAQHLSSTAPAITTVAPSVPPRLAAAVERCLHKEPLRRYRNAESFAEAIDLAFEHAKEIPAPLRVWLSQGEKELPARVAFVGIGGTMGVTSAFVASAMSFSHAIVALTVLCPLALLTALSFIPSISRLRRVLADGYVVDDLHTAMREQQLARAEEMEYERRLASPRYKQVMRVLLGTSVGATGLVASMEFALSRLPVGPLAQRAIDADHQQNVLLAFLALSLLTFSSVSLGGEFVRLHLADRLTTRAIGFWKGRWGARLATFASLGLKPAERPTLGMPLLTEVALGRATDHLFAALPKASRRELAALPATVRQLEGDAGRLRSAVAQLDDQLAVFDRGRDTRHDAERARVAGDLEASRATARERLASTVAALEGIRLDLLRLQLGSTDLASVTASIDEARRIGDQIADSIAAQRAVEQLLVETASEPDTPAFGVAAARG